MVVSAGLGNDDGAEADAGQLVGVVDQVRVVVPGDHQDGRLTQHRAQHLLGNRQEPHLEDELHAGLGEDGEGAEHPGPGQRLELEEVLLPPADHDQVPHHQAHLQPTIGSPSIKIPLQLTGNRTGPNKRLQKTHCPTVTSPCSSE